MCKNHRNYFKSKLIVKSDKSYWKIDNPRHIRNKLGFKDYVSNDKFQKRLPAVGTYVVTSCLIAA